jgi:two-component system OmpR family sensor kinase
MRWRRCSVALIPIAAGLVVASLFAQVSALPNPIIYVHVDVGTAALLAGLALSILAAAGLGSWEWKRWRCEQRIASVRTQAAEERRRFLQRLDHEMKNPLTAIRAGLANLANGLSPATQEEALASVEAQVLRLSQLTADLRKLAELETRALERVPVDVAELLQEAVALAQEQPEAAGRRLTLVLPQAPWPVPDVPGDWDLVFLAAYNLLDNALKFTRPGDTVEVRAFEDGTFVAIEVADTGPGIPEEEVPRVWEELYRGQGARGVPGSGLGLALVRAIAERHGGQVTLRSRAGQGTVVTMRLPAKSSHNPSILPLLAFLLSATVLVFTACGTRPPDSAPTETPWLITPTPTAPTPTPAKILAPSDSAPTVTPVAENPLPPAFCRPDEAAMTLSATATTLGVGQVVTVKITLVNGETSNVRLGQPQYMLYVHPDVFSLDGMKPVEQPVTIEPGQSDEIEFTLQAATPGRAMLMGSVSYEMHDLEYSWGSWSGCRTEPLEITVTQ